MNTLQQPLTSIESAICRKILLAHPLFTKFSDDQITALVQQCSSHVVKRGENIVVEEDVVDSVYLIVEGIAQVTRHFCEVRDTIVSTMYPMDIIGLREDGLYSATRKRYGTVVALTDMVLFRLHVDALGL